MPDPFLRRGEPDWHGLRSAARRRAFEQRKKETGDMPNYCNVVLVGHLTRDPELRMAKSGTAVANFGVAYNRREGDVTFLDCTAFRRTAEVIVDRLHCGDPVLVRGELSTDHWEDRQTGAKRSKIKLLVQEFAFLGGGGGGSNGGDSPSLRRDSIAAKTAQSEESDDVPF